MITEALEFLAEQAKAAVTAEQQIQVLKLPGEDDSRYAYVSSTGELKLMDARPSRRRSVLQSVGEVSAYCQWLISEHNSAPAVWYAPDGVVIVHNDIADADRRDVTRIPLSFTDQFKTIRSLKGSTFDQRGVIRLLRYSLHDCLGESGAYFLKEVRSIDFKSFTTGHGDYSNGRVSLGREIEEEVQTRTKNPLPDEIVLNVPIYTDPTLRGMKFPIRIGVEIEASNQTFALAPLAGELENVLDAVMEKVRDQCLPAEGGDDYEVFFGQP